MRIVQRTAALLVLLSLPALLAGCNSLTSPSSSRANLNLFVTHSQVTGGAGASVVSVTGTVQNTGDLPAHGVTVTGALAGRQASVTVTPSDLPPGDSGTWSLKMTGDRTPSLSVNWR